MKGIGWKRKRQVLLQIGILILAGTMLASCKKADPVSLQEAAASPPDLKTQIVKKMKAAGKGGSFQTLKGKFTTHFDKDTVEYEFQIRLGDKPAGNRSGKNLRYRNTYSLVYDGTYLLEEGTKYRDENARRPSGKEEQEVLAFSPAFPSVPFDAPFPAQLADRVLADKTAWEIEGEEPFLSRTAYVIKAGYDPRSVFQKKEQAVTRIWIDEQTGILLKLQYDEDTAMVMKELTVDGPLDESKLTIPTQDIAALNLSPAEEKKEQDQVRQVIVDFYKKSRNMYPSTIKNVEVTSIEREGSAVMVAEVELQLDDGSTKSNRYRAFHKNGKWAAEPNI